MTISEYDELDGLAMGELVRSRQVTARELLDEAIRRAEAVNPRLNAIVRPLYDTARDVAAQPLPNGPFAGVPFLLKDVGADLAGVPTTFGSRYLAGLAAARDCTLVRRFRDAGVVFFGKTNTPEFGLMPYTEPALFGPTRNPWDLDRTPGGSSGGAAAAVAAGIVPLAHGNDGGGSIRIPAACCGLFGLKPTRGRSPVGPNRSELWGGLAVDHVITRTVRDSAAMLDAIAAPDPAARFCAPRPTQPFQQEVGRPAGRLRIAMTTRPHLSAKPIHPDCASAVQVAAQVLAGLGHDVEEADPMGDAPGVAEDFLTIVSVELAAAAEEAATLVGRKPRLGEIEPQSALTVMIGRQPSAVAFARARERLAALARRVTAFFETYDVLLSPTLAEPPVAIGAIRPHGLEAWGQKLVAALHLGFVLRLPGVVRASSRRIFDFAAFTPIANVTGQPSMNVPLHWNDAGLPIGTMFTGRFGEEATLFRLAAELEAVCPWRHRRPAVRAGGDADRGGGDAVASRARLG